MTADGAANILNTKYSCLRTNSTNPKSKQVSHTKKNPFLKVR